MIVNMRNAKLSILSIWMIFFVFSVQAEDLSPLAAKEKVSVLVIDAEANETFPKNFRRGQDDFKEKIFPLPSREGLADLKASASAQFSQKGLPSMLKKMDGEVWIVDLRRESHGFINGIAVSWYGEKNQDNFDLTKDQIEQNEAELVAELNQQDQATLYRILEKRAGVIYRKEAYEQKIKSAETERSLVSRLSLGYYRMEVSDHYRPEDKVVDDFVSLIKELPENRWLHFHCRAGKGRSTTFMVMYDILKNSQLVSLADIVQRHALLGGVDLFAKATATDFLGKQEAMQARKDFILLFYQYARQGYPQLSWRAWLQQTMY